MVAEGGREEKRGGREKEAEIWISTEANHSAEKREQHMCARILCGLK